MSFVNSVPASPGYDIEGGSDNTLIGNCASCSAAGAVCLINHSHSSMASDLAQQFAYRVRGTKAEDTYKMGSNFTAQLQNVSEFILSRTGRRAIWSPEGMPLYAATAWMSLYTIGTVFVVGASGYVPSYSGPCNHMLNAIHNGNIAYVDFQCNRQQMPGEQFSSFSGHTGPATSDKPFISIITQDSATHSRQLHAAFQDGTFSPSTVRLRILAFPKNHR